MPRPGPAPPAPRPLPLTSLCPRLTLFPLPILARPSSRFPSAQPDAPSLPSLCPPRPYPLSLPGARCSPPSPQNSLYSKLEKADILEMTVQFLREVPAAPSAAGETPSPPLARPVLTAVSPQSPLRVSAPGTVPAWPAWALCWPPRRRSPPRHRLPELHRPPAPRRPRCLPPSRSAPPPPHSGGPGSPPHTAVHSPIYLYRPRRRPGDPQPFVQINLWPKLSSDCPSSAGTASHSHPWWQCTCLGAVRCQQWLWQPVWSICRHSYG